MWYAVQVRTGEEEKTRLICTKMLQDKILTECFIPYYERKKKYLGDWHKSEEILFPGYIFMVSDFREDLMVQVKHIPAFLKILGDGNQVIPLQEKEVEFLMQFGGRNHLIKISQGYMEADRVVITDGPMKDFKGIIKKIDRHKRCAVIEAAFFGRTMDIHVGLEIVKKI